MNSALTRLLFAFALLFSCALTIRAQTSSEQPKGSGSVSGRVRLGDQPAPGVWVVAFSADPARLRDGSPSARALTDDEGRYRISGLATGSFRVSAWAPAFVSPSEVNLPGPQGRPVSVGDGEAIENVDFTLIKGGVITGKITDPDGRPVISERVRLFRLDQNKRRQPFFTQYGEMFQTDDRGIYRLFGLVAGWYMVGAGVDAREGEVGFGAARVAYARTYYPDAAEAEQASVIEVEPGKELTGIDIRLREPAKGYEIRGRVIGEAGQPMGGITIGYGTLRGDGRNLGAYGTGGIVTSAQGEFRIPRLAPGKYAAFAAFEGERDLYSEAVPFEVSEADVAGLEIRIHRGATISGIVVIEGATDPNLVAKTQQLRLYAYTQSQGQLMAPAFGEVRVTPNGSFRFGGLRPGKVQINSPDLPKGLWLLRIERDGAPQPDGIEVAADEQISNVRVIFGIGSAVIRGQVKVVGGARPEGARLMAILRRSGSGWNFTNKSVEVDPRGRFTIEGVAAGEYDLILDEMFYGLPPGGQPQRRIPSTTEKVTVGGAGEVEVTITVNLNEQRKERQQ
jgi:protocatechuate 3,4-dioxygenase beta subunit